MIQQHDSQRRDLVGLYAGRMQARQRRLTFRANRRRAVGGVNQFGRRPHRPRQAWSGRRKAVSALMATAFVASAAQGVSAGTAYQIQPGDTLSEIAQRHGTTVEWLAELNSIRDPNVIEVGDTLYVSPPALVQPSGPTHVVQWGESLPGIAARYGVSAEELARINGIWDYSELYAESILLIPTGAEAPSVESSNTAATTQSQSDVESLHLIAPGETLSHIALRYGVSIEALAAANGITNVDLIHAGAMLKIPAGNFTTAGFSGHVAEQVGTVMLPGVPALKQSLSLSCESAALSMATAYWGFQVSEWVFIENMPYHPNPHHGFRGNMSGPFGGTDDYGVYARPLIKLLANYGFMGEEFYTFGDPALLKQRIDWGQPVVVWVSNMASVQERGYHWHEGERFTLVPTQHVVVVYGYDDHNVYVADPGDGQHRSFSWEDFSRSWGYFDGMSLAVYPKT
jgi:LysM repeat protein/uncharacterized protein YvpB